MKLRFFLALAIVSLLVFGAAARNGRVIFDDSEALNPNPEFQTYIVSFWEAYLHQDVNSLSQLLTPQSIRISPRSSGRQIGQGILDNLPQEWSAFERSSGVISEVMTIRRAEINVTGTSATASYWIEVVGGERWDYDDLAWVYQSFSLENGAWKILYQAEFWSLDYDWANNRPGAETFRFDLVYPVVNLERAIAFYTPLLGTAEYVTAEQAAFNLRGARFLLDSGSLEGYARIAAPLPGGYPIFYVDDLAATRSRLLADGRAQFLAGTEQTFLQRGADSYAIVLDPAGNVFVLMQQNFESSESGSPALQGFESSDPFISSAERLSRAWISQDSATIAQFLSPNTLWIDDTRSRIYGVQKGRDAILAALETVYWRRYDKNENGLLVNMTVSDIQVLPFGTGALVSFASTLQGSEAHPFRESAYVTYYFSMPDVLGGVFISASNAPSALALELDYTGTPVSDLAAAESFYTDALNLGQPYEDEAYRGYWSDTVVFGIYRARPEHDALPINERANSYISFWVNSAQATYDYLATQGSHFPLIEAINSQVGLDPQDGYIQVFATDSEGNGLLFTEYPGRAR